MPKAGCSPLKGWLSPLLAVLEVVLVARLELLVVAAAALGALRLEVRVLLAELFVRRRDQAEIMLGMLEIIFRRNRVARGLRVARELKIFFRDVVRGSADLHIRAVGFVNPCQGIVAAPVVIVVVIVVVAPTHALVVVMLLTVSHGLLFNNS